MATYAYTFTSGDTVTPTKLNNARTVSEIVNADIKSDAAIAGTKIAPNFGSQNIVTTGTLSANSAAFSGSITLPAAGGVSMASATNSALNFNGGTTFNTNGASIALRGSTATFNGHGLELYAGGAERMRIDASGNVGIGTASPSSAGGAINLVANSSGSTIIKSQTSSTTTGAARVDFSTGTANSFAIVSLSDNNGSPYFQISSGSAVTSAFYDFPAHIFRTSGGTERMRIDASGNLGIGTASPNAAALLDVSSTTKGFLPPRMTTAQRDAISSPPAGLVVYNTSTNVLNFYNGSAWGAV